MDLVTLAMAKSYTDSQRLAYTEGETKVIAPKGSLHSSLAIVDPNTNTPIDLALVEGETYTVNILGSEYTIVAVSMEGMVILLHATSFDAEGIPLDGFAVMPEDGIYRLQPFEESLNAELQANMVDNVVQDFSITQGKETIHPIDPKFLPGVCLPVVELETQVSFDAPVNLTENDIAKFAALDGKSPIVLGFVFEGMAYTTMSVMKAEVEGNIMFWGTANAFGYTLTIANTSGTWTLTIS